MSWLFFLISDSIGLCFTLCCMSWLFPLTEAPLSRFCSMTQSDQSRNSPNSWHVFFQFILFLSSKQLYWRIERQYGGKMEWDKKMGTRGFLRMLIDLSRLKSLDIFPLSKVSPLCSVSWLSASNRTHFPIPLSSKVSHYQKVKVDFPIFSSKWEPLPKSLFSFFHDHILVQFVDSIVWRKGKV